MAEGVPISLRCCAVHSQEDPPFVLEFRPQFGVFPYFDLRSGRDLCLADSGFLQFRQCCIWRRRISPDYRLPGHTWIPPGNRLWLSLRATPDFARSLVVSSYRTHSSSLGGSGLLLQPDLCVGARQARRPVADGHRRAFAPDLFARFHDLERYLSRPRSSPTV